jgi:hypothetical protein
MENKKTGVYLNLRYLGFRKRKTTSWGCSGDNLEECFNDAKKWKIKNKGKFVSGGSTICSFYDVDLRGEKIRMNSVPIFSPMNILNEQQILELNGN